MLIGCCEEPVSKHSKAASANASAAFSIGLDGL
ncbi:hypothetical protein N181_09140 [Sinorhizobium fredii USDA 205]|nr:hypothetical protein N181_09140 [Sinorhizobium fredii USDA 205]